MKYSIGILLLSSVCLQSQSISYLAGKVDDMTPEAEETIVKGLDFLATNQQKDGSWGIGVTESIVGAKSNRVAKTSLACLALMANGNLINKGKYAENVRRGLEFVLDNAKKRKGHITDWKTNDWSDTHNHGYGLLFLAFVYGSVSDSNLTAELKDIIEKAIALTLKAQTSNGGWGYSITTPNHNNMKDEGSCTITQIRALRACKDAGFCVPKERIEKAVEYIKKSAYKGGFYYALEYNGKPLVRLGDSTYVPESRPRFAVTAASVAVLNAYGSAGKDSSEINKLVDGGLKYLFNFIPNKKEKWDDYDFFYYGNFYAVQAMMAAGGNWWKEYWPSVRDQLVKRQTKKGAWEDEKRWGQADEYVDTAFALLILQAPHRHIPIYVE